MRDRRYVEDLSLEELEQELYVRRREERLARLRRIGPARHSSEPILVEEGLAYETLATERELQASQSRHHPHGHVWYSIRIRGSA